MAAQQGREANFVSSGTQMPPQGGKHVTLRDAQRDWRVLDTPSLTVPAGVRLISHERFSTCPEFQVDYIRPSWLSRVTHSLKPLSDLLYAAQLLGRCTSDTVLILNGGGSLPLFTGLLNRLFFLRRRRILCWDLFVEVNERWKIKLVRAAMGGMTLCLVWSKDQVPAHARFLDMPEERFLFIPYKANHSKNPHYDLPMGNFIFAGGNGKRDYQCLIAAVRHTGIPVVISATNPQVRGLIEPMGHVIVLGAPEPAFAQLQAASRFVVFPMIFTGLKGGGEANFCNGMWHGKPVIAADSIAAKDYIIDGETGYVVPSGDAEALRQRILELWNDPERVARMGVAARRHAEESFTHQAFIRRLLRVAALLGRSSQ